MSNTATWKVLLELLQFKETVKVLYHTQVAMLAVHPVVVRFKKADSSFIGGSGVLENAFDPRIAVYLSDTTSSEEDLELRRICDRCTNMPIVYLYMWF